MSRIIVVVVFAWLVTSCHHSTPDVQQHVVTFATMECEAIRLRKERFLLADQIRFTQDSLALTKKESERAKLKNKLVDFDQKKALLVEQSVNLADSIKTTLRNLFSQELKAKENKEAFNGLLQDELRKRGCEEYD